MEWGKLLYVIGAVLMAWFVYRVIRRSPAAFSGSNIGKSLSTLGVLALILIVFIGILVVLLKGI